MSCNQNVLHSFQLHSGVLSSRKSARATIQTTKAKQDAMKRQKDRAAVESVHWNRNREPGAMGYASAY